MLRQEEDGHRRCPLQGAFERELGLDDEQAIEVSLGKEEEHMDKSPANWRFRRGGFYLSCEANADIPILRPAAV